MRAKGLLSVVMTGALMASALSGCGFKPDITWTDTADGNQSNYKVTVVVAHDGKLSIDREQTVKDGGTLNFVATPAEGNHKITGLMVDGVVQEYTGTLPDEGKVKISLENINQDMTVVVLCDNLTGGLGGVDGAVTGLDGTGGAGGAGGGGSSDGGASSSGQDENDGTSTVSVDLRSEHGKVNYTAGNGISGVVNDATKDINGENGVSFNADVELTIDPDYGYDVSGVWLVYNFDQFGHLTQDVEITATSTSADGSTTATVDLSEFTPSADDDYDILVEYAPKTYELTVPEALKGYVYVGNQLFMDGHTTVTYDQEVTITVANLPSNEKVSGSITVKDETSSQTIELVQSDDGKEASATFKVTGDIDLSNLTLETIEPEAPTEATVNVTINGKGTVYVGNEKIENSQTVTAEYNENGKLTIRAVADDGSKFASGYVDNGEGKLNLFDSDNYTISREDVAGTIKVVVVFQETAEESKITDAKIVSKADSYTPVVNDDGTLNVTDLFDNLQLTYENGSGVPQTKKVGSDNATVVIYDKNDKFVDYQDPLKPGNYQVKVVYTGKDLSGATVTPWETTFTAKAKVYVRFEGNGEGAVTVGNTIVDNGEFTEVTDSTVTINIKSTNSTIDSVCVGDKALTAVEDGKYKINDVTGTIEVVVTFNKKSVPATKYPTVTINPSVTLSYQNGCYVLANDSVTIENSSYGDKVTDTLSMNNYGTVSYSPAAADLTYGTHDITVTYTLDDGNAIARHTFKNVTISAANDDLDGLFDSTVKNKLDGKTVANASTVDKYLSETWRRESLADVLADQGDAQKGTMEVLCQWSIYNAYDQYDYTKRTVTLSSYKDAKDEFEAFCEKVAYYARDDYPGNACGQDRFDKGTIYTYFSYNETTGECVMAAAYNGKEVWHI